jgi:hypothetical protein
MLCALRRKTLFTFLQKCRFRLFDTLPVWAGNADNEDLILGKTGKYSKRRSGGIRRRFIFHLVLERKVLMNKRIVAISVLLLMMCAMAASVFADDAKQYEYSVSVTLRNDSTGNTKTETVKIWASSQSEARAEAEAACDWKFPGWTLTSCGYPVATGNSR